MDLGRELGRGGLRAVIVGVLVVGALVWSGERMMAEKGDSTEVGGAEEKKKEGKGVPGWVTVMVGVGGTAAGSWVTWRIGKRAQRMSMRGERKEVYDALKRLESLAMATHRVEWKWAMECGKGVGGAKHAFWRDKKIEKHIAEVLGDAGAVMFKCEAGELGDEDGKKVNAQFRKHMEKTERLFGKYLGEK